MKPTKAFAHRAGHHHTPEEMHNDDVAHEHSDINIRAIVMVDGRRRDRVVAGTAVLMAGPVQLLEPQAAASDPKLSPLAMPATTMPPTTTASPAFGGAPEPQLMTNEPVASTRSGRPSGRAARPTAGSTRRRRRAHPDRRGEEADRRAGPAGAAGSGDRRAPRHAGRRVASRRRDASYERLPAAGSASGPAPPRAGGGQDGARVNGSGLRVRGDGTGSWSNEKEGSAMSVSRRAGSLPPARRIAQTPGSAGEPAIRRRRGRAS